VTIPTRQAATVAAGVCDVPAIKAICSTVGTSAGTVVAAPLNYVAASAGGAAKWMFTSVWAVFDASTIVDVTAPEFVKVYNLLFGIAIVIMVLFFLLQLITGLLRRDPSALTRAVVGLGKAVIGSFLVVGVTGILLTIVDQLSIGIVQATGTTMQTLGAKIAALGVGLTALNLGSPGVGAIVTIFLAGLAITGTALLWFSLLIRKALLLVLIVLAPIALSGAVWDTTRGWAGRWASTVVALAISKLVIVVVFLIATAQLTTPVAFDLHGVSEPIAGIVLMFVAAFAPYMCYRFVSFIGFDVYHAVAAEQDSKQALNRPIPLPNRAPTSTVRPILDSLTGSRGGNTGGTSSSATPPPERPRGPGTTSASSAGTGSAVAGGATTGGGASAGGAAGGCTAAAAAAGPVGVGAAAGLTVAGTAATAGTRAARATRGAVAEHTATPSTADSVTARPQTPVAPVRGQTTRPAPPTVLPPRPQGR
jgi:hypothetical protein